MTWELAIEGRFMDPLNGEFRGWMGISEGRIGLLTERPIAGDTVLRLSGSEMVFPGFIDTHVHFREPGWEHKGDMATESRAAALGGVTTAMDMPNTPVQTVSRERVLEKKGLAQAKAVIDMEFYCGVGPGNLYVLGSVADVVPAYKMFMTESSGNLMLSGNEIEEAFSCLSGIGRPLAIHCEDTAMNRKALGEHGSRFGELGPIVHALSRPPESEHRAVSRALELSREHDVPVSICHVSTAQALGEIRRDGKARCEATIHHSLYDHDDLRRLGSLAKMNPPLRSREDADAIMKGLLGGEVDFLGTDHAPHSAEEKARPFPEAPSGVPSAELYGSFACLLLSRGMEPRELARLTSYRAAEFFGLVGKGRIEEGFLADLTVLETRRPHRVNRPYQSKAGWSPYEGLEFPGRPSYTIRRGRIIAEDGKVLV